MPKAINLLIHSPKVFRRCANVDRQKTVRKFHVAMAHVKKIADAAPGISVTVKPSDTLPMK